MKIIGVISSTNVNGNSATLLREVLAGARNRQAQTEELLLPKLNIGFCSGCLRCMADGRCFQNDDFEAVRKMLTEADGIVLSTPVYGAAPCARLKNLIDRLGLFEYMTASVFKGKHVAAIATAKTSGADKTVAYLRGIMENGIFGKAYLAGALPVVLRQGRTAKDSPEILAKANRLGAKLVDDFERKATHPLRGVIGRFFMDAIVRPQVAKSIIDYRDRGMGGVYANLRERGLIAG